MVLCLPDGSQLSSDGDLLEQIEHNLGLEQSRAQFLQRSPTPSQEVKEQLSRLKVVCALQGEQALVPFGQNATNPGNNNDLVIGRLHVHHNRDWP